MHRHSLLRQIAVALDRRATGVNPLRDFPRSAIRLLLTLLLDSFCLVPLSVDSLQFFLAVTLAIPRAPFLFDAALKAPECTGHRRISRARKQDVSGVRFLIAFHFESM